MAPKFSFLIFKNYFLEREMKRQTHMGKGRGGETHTDLLSHTEKERISIHLFISQQ